MAPDVEGTQSMVAPAASEVEGQLGAVPLLYVRLIAEAAIALLLTSL